MNTERDARFSAFAKATDAILVKEPDIGFAEAVNAYRQVGANFAAQAPTDEYFVLETKRRIAESILVAAQGADQPFEVCHEIWNELVGLGFSNIHVKRMMSWFYADTCLTNERYDTGLEVIEPVIAEYEQSLLEKELKPEIRELCDRELANLRLLRDGLIAFRTGEAEANAWMEREEAEIEARKAQQPPVPE